MAKIQRLKIPTDQKMAMLRGQPGHMPAPVTEPIEPASEATPEPTTPEVLPVIEPSPVEASETPLSAPTTPEGVPEPEVGQNRPVAAALRRGPGRPRKTEAAVVAPVSAVAPTTGLPPSLIRLEGAAQFAALSYVREEMLRGRRVYLKQLVDEAILYYLEHGPPAKQG